MRTSRLAAVVSALATTALAATTLVVSAPSATAAPGDERVLADRYAPVVRLVAQPDACGPGEPFVPTDVAAVLDDEGVALRGPWTTDDLVKIGPGAEDLGRGLAGHHLDFPGDPLDPGCTYEQWSDAITQGTRPTTYARVVTEEGREGLALQYWLYYTFNDFNNKHESDWEMLQLEFAASDAAAALGAGTDAGRLQPARGCRGRRLGRRQARGRRQDAPGGAPRRRVARQLLRRRAVPRPLGPAGLRLRRHPGDRARPASGRRARALRPRGGRRASSRGSTTPAGGASGSRASTTGRPVRTPRTSGRLRCRGARPRGWPPATPSPPAVSSARRRRAPSAGSSPSGSDALRRAMSNPARALAGPRRRSAWCWSGSSAARRGGPRRRCASPGDARPARCCPRCGGCTCAACPSSSGSACRSPSRWSSRE